MFLFKDSGGRVPVVSFTINEYDSDAFMRQAWNMTDTDGGAPVFGQGVPHPRTYGAFPHKIQRNVIERKIITLEQAIYSGTGLTASVHGPCATAASCARGRMPTCRCLISRRSRTRRPMRNRIRMRKA